MILRAQRQTVGDKTLISGLRWYVSDRYRLLNTVGGVDCDFSQTEFDSDLRGPLFWNLAILPK